MNYLINLGLNDKNTKTQLISQQDALNMLFNMLDGATITPCIGIYTHDDGTKVMENSFKIEVYDMDDDQAEALARTLCDEFNQESVILTPFNTPCKFISA